LTDAPEVVIVIYDRGGDKPEIKPFEPDPDNAGGGSQWPFPTWTKKNTSW